MVTNFTTTTEIQSCTSDERVWDTSPGGTLDDDDDDDDFDSNCRSGDVDD